ncbi:MAG: dTDP-4-dehydrorhamnose reductase [Casimicrobiaceae bacterium]|nr:dTDP-4-dehydrorhamnose reductase [Casimicrobiaceae bacterium]
MKVLITGAGGQLARALMRALHSTHEVIALDRSALELTDRAAIRDTLRRSQPEVVLNCAAYTAVDRAESERERAFAVNAHAAAWLAEAASALGSVLVHFSTDYVFDGRATRPYREEDATAPLNVYGASKLAGEQAVLAHGGHLVLRLSWVYSHEGANFYRTILRLARERGRLRVVADQRGVPNYVGDLAEAIAAMLAHGKEALAARAGLYHLSARGETTWHGFACQIVRRHGLSERITVEAITTAQYPTAARRPAYSVLDASRFSATFGWQPPQWSEGLARCVAASAEAS